MHIAVDARFLTHPQAGGFRTYTRELCFALARMDTPHRFTLYVDRVPFSADDVPTGDNITVTVVDGTRPFVGMPVREQLGLRAAVWRDKPDVLHCLTNTAPLSACCPLVVTLHDTLWLAPFAGGSVLRRFLHGYTRRMARGAAKRAQAVCVPSEFVKRGIVNTLRVDAGRVFVTLEAGGGALFGAAGTPPAAQRPLDKTGRSFFALALGAADPRKNLPFLARAWAALPGELRQTHRLVTVWADGSAGAEFGRLCRELGIAGSVDILPSVTDEALQDLYRAASAFLFPSLSEGFGLPALEAMACGCPVVASNTSSLPEVCGDAALLVDPLDTQSWTAAIASVLTNATLHKRLSARGRRRAALFSWDECARLTLAAYARARVQ